MSVNALTSVARKLAPLLMLDRAEPFRPETVAVTAAVAHEESQAFPGAMLVVPEGGVCVEYTIWWNGNIRHLYGLEHAWIRAVEEDGRWRILTIHISHDGDIHQLETWRESDGRPILYCEPGGHTMTGALNQLRTPVEITDWRCGEDAGLDGMKHPGHPHVRFTPTAHDHRRAVHHMRALSFTPAWQFTHAVDLREVAWEEWGEMAQAAPGRIREQLDKSHDGPLALHAGPWTPPEGEYVEVHDVEVSDGHLQLDGLPAYVRFSQLLTQRRRMLLNLPASPQADVLASLRDSAWDAKAIAAILVSCEPEQERSVREHGLTPALWWYASQEPPVGGWVRVLDEQTARLARPYALVIGPAYADLIA